MRVILKKVIDRHTSQKLTNAQILSEVNNERSDEWQKYDLKDLKQRPTEVVSWLDPEYYDVVYAWG